MCTIPFARWISNAAVRFSGIRGAVSIQARRGDCSRQAIYDQGEGKRDITDIARLLGGRRLGNMHVNA